MTIPKIFRDPYALFVIVVPVVAVCVYIGIHQFLRNEANNPQIALAQMSAQALSTGANPSEVVPVGAMIDLASVESVPFIIIYDASGTPLASTGILEKQVPTPPLGVFSEAERRREYRVTWAPLPRVRIATVIVPYHGVLGNGYVLAGRSLRSTEAKISVWGTRILTLWAGIMALLSFSSLIQVFLRKRSKN